MQEKDQIYFVEKPGPTTEEDGASNTPKDPSEQAAFDPSTKTINWDCPCLGGMAYGPCGAEFREAFTCFVFSEDNERKGAECVDKFREMQNCFTEFPEYYADQLKDDEEEADSHSDINLSEENASNRNNTEENSKDSPSDSRVFHDSSALQANPNKMASSPQEN